MPRPLIRRGAHSFRPIGKTLISAEIMTVIRRRIELERTRPSNSPYLWCHTCKKSPGEAAVKEVKRCSRCQLVTYCSKECQKSDWKHHKSLCEDVIDVKEWAIIRELEKYTVVDGSIPPIEEINEFYSLDSDEVENRYDRNEDQKEELKRERSEEIGFDLTDCAAHNFVKVQSLTEEQLERRYKLPCCGYYRRFHSERPEEDLPEPESSEASLKDLVNGSVNCGSCRESCFYSFCLDQVVFMAGFPPGILHCEICDRCVDYMCDHCSACEKCSYGGCFEVPCANCHVMGLCENGLVFKPINTKACLNENTECDCLQGKLWCHPMINFS